MEINHVGKNMFTAQDKLEKLKEYFGKLGSVAVAYSSGVDSTFMLKVAHDVLVDRAIALTAEAVNFPSNESEEAGQFCDREKIQQIIYEFQPLEVEGFAANLPDRCYHCKKKLFEQFIKIANEQGIRYVAEGSNMDDIRDYRPGLKAVEELGVISPLRYAALSKAEIRLLSRELGLDTWSKPSCACLASRFPYGDRITEEKLEMVGRAEQIMRNMGFKQMRVRFHGNKKEGSVARIEVLPEEFEYIMKERVRLVREFRNIGFTYVSMDMIGYRTGSLNEVLDSQIGK